MAETKITTGVSLDPGVVDGLDALTQDEKNTEFFGRSRSSVIEAIIRKFLANVKKKSRR